MQYRTVVERIGENMGPVDWSHETARDLPQTWRDAEQDPNGYLFNGQRILEICMYDGWPYWKPTPAIHFIGPLNSGEWTFFNSYDVNPSSIQLCPEAIVS